MVSAKVTLFDLSSTQSVRVQCSRDCWCQTLRMIWLVCKAAPVDMDISQVILKVGTSDGVVAICLNLKDDLACVCHVASQGVLTQTQARSSLRLTQTDLVGFTNENRLNLHSPCRAVSAMFINRKVIQTQSKQPSPASVAVQTWRPPT